MKTYSSITASRDTMLFQRILLRFMLLIMIILTILIWFHYTEVGDIPLTIVIITVIPPSLYSFVRIINYSKREIINLLSPSGSRKIFKTLSTFMSHPVELIIIPAYIAAVLYLYLSSTGIAFYTSTTIIVAVIYATQILPLMIKRELHIRASKRALNYVRDEIKTTRIILFNDTFSEEDKDLALSRHIAAEELMSVHSDYLIYSTGISGTFIMIARLILPVFTGIGGQIIQPMLGG
ncbi:MAG: hypothetical protein GF411_03005 [Candidatus Lokiarchaeota archaeon]|nr:hypothetical protein [Candidatus Lokiarchaeota archaeon]